MVGDKQVSENEDYYAGFSLGRITERERIIKLLANTPIEFWYEVNYEGLVAFIQGENK